MSVLWVECYRCGKDFLKDKRHVNEGLNLGYKFYCSPICLSSARNKEIEVSCENCNKKFTRQPSDVSKHNYCSHSCAATITNTYRKRNKVLIKCSNCEKNVLKSDHKYCSLQCFRKWYIEYWRNYKSIYTKDVVLKTILEFVKIHGRIPVKRELYKLYEPALKYFGTWNKAIEAAGFEPNPVLFAKKQMANDGHICDSLAEKMIDDFLYEKGIKHDRNFPYPEKGLTADFKIGSKLIEYFGLAGEHKRYDELRSSKQMLARKYGLKLVEIYPKDLYPKHSLDKLFP